MKAERSDEWRRGGRRREEERHSEEKGQTREMFSERRKTPRDEGDTIPDRKLMSFFFRYYLDR